MPLRNFNPSSHCTNVTNAMCVSRYGGEHRAPELQKEAVYGLTELHREDVKKARLVANPGCYPTSVQLPLCPLLEVGCYYDFHSTAHASAMEAEECKTYDWCLTLHQASHRGSYGVISWPSTM